MTVHFYLTRPNSDTETSIYARICYNGFKVKFYTSERIYPKFWNKEKQRAKQTDKFREYPEFNNYLDQLAADIKNVFRTWVNDNGRTIPNPKTFKAILDKELKKIEPEKERLSTFFGFFEDVLERTKKGERVQPVSGKPYSRATIQVYETTLNRLKEFSERHRRKIDFPTIDLDFYDCFTAYLAKELLLNPTTIGKEIKTLKTILNEATERGFNTNMQFKSRKFSVTSESSDAIYLTKV